MRPCFKKKERQTDRERKNELPTVFLAGRRNGFGGVIASGHFDCDSVGEAVFLISLDIVRDNVSQKL